MGNCNCFRETHLNVSPKSDINVEEDLKDDYPFSTKEPVKLEKIQINNHFQYKENTRKESKKIAENEKEIILDNLSVNNIQNNQVRKIFETIVEDEEKKSNKGKEKEKEKKKEKEKEKIIKSKTLEIKEMINSKEINLKRNEKDKNFLKILLVGDKFVGKSSIIFQFISNKFDHFYITTIFKEDFSKKIKIGESQYEVCLSCLPEDSIYLEDSYNKNNSNIYDIFDYFLLVFDLTNLESFHKLKDILYKDIKDYIGLISKSQYNMCLIGNKCDLKDKKVNDNEINEFCRKYNLDYYEVSAKHNRNIIKCFSRITEIYDEIINN
jgi:Ras-related protein Rab-7A/Rab family protein